LPVIEEDVIETVPEETLTPPPYKQRSKRESPMGAMGTFEVSGADGTYPLLVDRGSTHHPRRELILAWVS